MAFNLQVFNQETYIAMTESVAQAVDKFNDASSGAIVLQNKPAKGDFDIAASFALIGNMVRRRNVYDGGNAMIPKARLNQLKNVSVKVASGTPQISWEPAQYTWTQQNPSVAAVTLGEQLGKARMADMLNTGISAACSAFLGHADIVVGDSTRETSFALLNQGAAKMGDRSSALVAWVMHSGVFHKLMNSAITNVERLFSYNTTNVLRDPAGRIFVVTDAPGLIDTSGSDPVYRTLGLQSGSILLSGNDDFNAVLETRTGTENIQANYQAEWSFNLGMYGYSWNTVAGGASPNDTSLGTSSNWDRIATSVKDTAGVCIVSK